MTLWVDEPRLVLLLTVGGTTDDTTDGDADTSLVVARAVWWLGFCSATAPGTSVPVGRLGVEMVSGLVGFDTPRYARARVLGGLGAEVTMLDTGATRGPEGEVLVERAWRAVAGLG